jgi:hypothetical protein
MKPARKPMTGEQIERWMADMNRLHEELGDFIPEGRNQPPMPEPTEDFKTFFGIGDVED